MFKAMHKGVSTKEMFRFAQDAHRANIMLLGDFVFGLPGETKETAEKTIEFAKKLKCDHVQFLVSQHLFLVQELYRWADENSFLLTDDMEKSIDLNGFQKCIISYPEFTKDRYRKIR